MLRKMSSEEDSIGFPAVELLAPTEGPIAYKMVLPKDFRCEWGGKTKRKTLSRILILALNKCENIPSAAKDLWEYMFCFSPRRYYTIDFNIVTFSHISKKQ